MYAPRNSESDRARCEDTDRLTFVRLVFPPRSEFESSLFSRSFRSEREREFGVNRFRIELMRFRLFFRLPRILIGLFSTAKKITMMHVLWYLTFHQKKSESEPQTECCCKVSILSGAIRLALTSIALRGKKGGSAVT